MTAIIHDDRDLGFGSDAAVIYKVNVEYQSPDDQFIVAAGNALYHFTGTNGRFNFARG